jgi:hypothetical protein
LKNAVDSREFNRLRKCRRPSRQRAPIKLLRPPPARILKQDGQWHDRGSVHALTTATPNRAPVEVDICLKPEGHADPGMNGCHALRVTRDIDRDARRA